MILRHLASLNSSTSFVLASASPRRREILKTIGLEHVVVVASAFEENLDKNEYNSASEYAKATAMEKARDVLEGFKRQGRMVDVIVGADTVVEARDGRVMEKPKSASEAREMLRALSNGTSKVHTGVAIILPKVRRDGLEGGAAGDGSLGLERGFSETTTVEFATLREEEIDAYIATGEPFDKAGGYGIQGPAGAFVRGIVGDYSNVMGFPMHAFARELEPLVPLITK